MTRLSQIIAVEKGVKADAERARREAAGKVANAGPLSGISKTYRPRDEEGDQLPPESTKVQVRTEEVIDDVTASLVRLFDVTLTREQANAAARADVKVNGHVLLPKVPVTYLLFLEKQLAEVAAFVARLPLLDPAEEWSEDAASGVWRTSPTMTMRGKKIPRNHVVAEATKEHPAQVQVYMEDVPAGDWTTVKFSGAVPATRVRTIQERVTALQVAVKYAREEANSADITDRNAGAAVFGYIFAALGCAASAI